LFEVNVEPSDSTYPCDTGAHQARRYSPYLDGVKLPELDCTAIDQADQRIVSRFFGTNDNYFYGAAKAALSPPLSKTAAAFHSLLVSEDDRPHDDRCLSIEIQRSRVLRLDGALKAVLVPDFLMAEAEVNAKLEHWKSTGVNVKPYRSQTISNAARTVEQFFPVVAQLQGIS
jgi:hypothetical protein